MSAQFRKDTTVYTFAGPDMGDAAISPHPVRLHLSMAGNMRTTLRKPKSAGKLLLTFSSLTLEEYTNILSFATGEIIRYVGPQGIWICRIMNNPMERVARARSRYSVTLELVGRQRLGFLLLQTGGYLLLQNGCYLELQESL